MSHPITVAPGPARDTLVGGGGYAAAMPDGLVVFPVGAGVPCDRDEQLAVEVERFYDHGCSDPARVALVNELGQSRSLSPRAARDLAARLVAGAELAERFGL